MILLLKLTLVLAAGLAVVASGCLTAAHRYLAGLLAILCLPLVVALHVLLPDLQPLSMPVPEVGLILFQQIVPVVTAETGAPSPSLYLPTPAGLVTTVYLFGFSVLLFRVARQIRLAHAWVRQRQVVDQVQTLSGAIPVVLVAGVRSPFTWGVFQPVIVVPQQWYSWDSTCRQMVYLHERAHIERRDLFWSFVVRIVCAMFWFHPLVWWLHYKLRHEAECACDDYVIRAGIPAAEYADQLIKITRFARPRGALAMASRSKLAARITALLDNQVRRFPMKKWQFWTTAVLSSALLLPVISLGAARPSQLSGETLAVLTTVQEDLTAHRFEQGERLARQLSEQEGLSDADLGQVWNMLGYAHVLQDELAQAIDAYERILTVRDSVPEGLFRITLYTLARLEYVQGNHAHALAHIEQWFAVAATPGAEPHVLRGRILLALGRFAEAAEMVATGQALAADHGRPDIPAWQHLHATIQSFAAGDTPDVPAAQWVADNSDYMPLAKVAPVYPPEAEAQRIEGYVLVEFTVAANGNVETPQVIESVPPGVFDEAALLAASRFRYKPQRIGGEAVPVTGIRNRITFALQD
ncbi:MAG: TonB family protein [Pseudomonadales bacterium]